MKKKAKAKKAAAPAVADYSPKEKAVLAVIRQGKVDTNTLVEKVYGEGRPFNARQAIVATVTSLIMKAKRRNEKFTVKRSPRMGPKSIFYWIEEST